MPNRLLSHQADLGTLPLPTSQCEKDAWRTDGDNYLDVCLDLPPGGPPPAAAHLPCGNTTQITAPKGLRSPCRPQTVRIEGGL